MEFARNLRTTDGKFDKNKSAVLVPFDFALKNAFPKRDMNDVTNVKRFTRFQTLSTITQIDIRPIIRIAPHEKALDPTAPHAVVNAADLASADSTDNNVTGEPLREKDIPIVVFADTEKAIELMQDASNTGLRPEQRDWYRDVFLKAYDAKKEPDSKERDGKIVKEDRIALKPKDLVVATMKYRDEIVSVRDIREKYLEPLYNNGIIDKADSQTDKRGDIFYPITALLSDAAAPLDDNADITTIAENKNKKLERSLSRSNFLEDLVLRIADSSKFPTEESIKSRIQTVLRYYDESGYAVKLLDGRETETDLDTIIKIYFNRESAERCFKVDASKEDSSS